MNQELLLILKELKRKARIRENQVRPFTLCFEIQKQKEESKYCGGIGCDNCILTKYETGIEHTLEKLNESRTDIHY